MSIATNRRDVDRELERRITAVKALDSSRYKSIRTLHFEGISDWRFVLQFCQKHDSLKKKIGNQNATYSVGKEHAIKNHKEAIGLGFKISTIVDMDHDFKGHEISKKISKGSQNEYIKHPNIRSTNPGCVLLTLLLLEEGRLEEAIKRVSLLNEPTGVQIRIIIKHATERTIKRVHKGMEYQFRYTKSVETLTARLKKGFSKKFPNPMNDHALCEAIYLHRSGTYQEEADDWKWETVEEETRYSIQESLKESTWELGSKTLEDIVDSMWTETKTTF
jgi:hypothetical protein